MAVEVEMNRTTVMFPPVLKRKAVAAAKRQGISLGRFIRQSVEQSLEKLNGRRVRDPLFDDDFVYEDDGPADLAANHDKYLDKMLLEEHDRQVRGWKRKRR